MKQILKLLLFYYFRYMKSRTGLFLFKIFTDFKKYDWSCKFFSPLKIIELINNNYFLKIKNNFSVKNFLYSVFTIKTELQMFKFLHFYSISKFLVFIILSIFRFNISLVIQCFDYPPFAKTRITTKILKFLT